MGDEAARKRGVRSAGGEAGEPTVRMDDAPPRRPAGRKEVRKAGAKRKVCLSLNAEFALRLGVVSAMRGIEAWELVEEQLGPYLRSWRLPSRSGDVGDRTPPEEVSAA